MDQLLPVIVGGLIGLAGGIVGPPLAHWLNEGSSNKKKRAEKLEEMIGYIYGHDHWLTVMRNIRVFGEQDNRDPSPLPKAQAIAAVYFSDFVPELTELENVARPFELWMLEKGQQRLAGNMEGLADGQIDAYRPYMNKRDELLGKLRALAAAEVAGSSVPWKRTKKVV